jgi:hypothetical protein
LREDFCARLRREIPGWAPADALALSEWVRERAAIPLDEWEALLSAAPAELREAARAEASLGGRITRIKREGAATAAVVHRDLAEAWKAAAIRLLGPWLRFQGPVSPDRIGEVFGTGAAETEAALLSLSESEELVRVTGTETAFVCDRENLELLLRLSRKKNRPRTAERPAALIAPFLARRQGILAGGPDAPPWSRLLGCAAGAAL